MIHNVAQYAIQNYATMVSSPWSWIYRTRTVHGILTVVHTTMTESEKSTNTEQEQAQKTSEWETELCTCPDCGSGLAYKFGSGLEVYGDGYATGTIKCETELCGFEAREHWELMRTEEL